MKTLKQLKEVVEKVKKTMYEQNGNTNTNLKRKQKEILGVKSTINEMKSSLEGVQDKIVQAEEKNCQLGDKTKEITKSKEEKEKRSKKSEQNLRDLWDSSKKTSIRIVGVPEREEREKGAKRIFDVWETPKFEERHDYKLSGSSTNTKDIVIKLPDPKTKDLQAGGDGAPGALS